jgi:hypothetical protein
MIIRMVTDFTENHLINDQNLKELEADVKNTISQLPKTKKST